ncbi:hypothetical protein AWJ20_4014 [Sugiyamaella lignohabitans]|uniref:O-methyltransferas-like protein family 3 n=1 Tax=Sugiyamaella lignohabitans TaxID=796027 RepID=A0A167C4Q0_9ASCO|nr:uncharacterized protein AWJ20_4014 [Sugiyamaella lignohabitans]ANB11212.1 hypothetical protein AWJ20_4014 [Sugiyamaella lignohabitans]
MSSSKAFKSHYEQDERWTAVDEYTNGHLHNPDTHGNSKVLSEALSNSIDKGLPDISTFPSYGKLLALQAKLAGADYALEVGTLGGYTSIWLATENPNIKIVTLEVNQHHADVALENLRRAGVADRVEIIVGPALETLPKLAEEIAAGKRQKFGFTFIDADKTNNWNYFDWAVKISRSRAVIVVDNVVRNGTIVAKEKLNDPNVSGARNVIERVGKDNRVDAVVQQTVGEKNYDGFLLAIVK